MLVHWAVVLGAWAVLLGAGARAAEDRELRWLEDPTDPEVVEWSGARNQAALEWLDADGELDGLTALAGEWRREQAKHRSIVDAVGDTLLVSEQKPDPGNDAEPERKLWRYHSELRVESPDGTYTVDLTGTGTESWWRSCANELSSDGAWLLWGRRRPEPDPLDPNRRVEHCLLFVTKVGSQSHQPIGEYRRGYTAFSRDGESIRFLHRGRLRTRITQLDLNGVEQDVLLSRPGCWARAELDVGVVLLWKGRWCRSRRSKWRPHSLTVDGQTERYRVPRINHRFAGYDDEQQELLVRVERGASDHERVVALPRGRSSARSWSTLLEDTELQPFRSVAWVDDRFLVISEVDATMTFSERSRTGELLGEPLQASFSAMSLRKTRTPQQLVTGISPRGSEVWARTRDGVYRPLQADPEGVKARFFQVSAVSEDGTEVPVSVVMPEGLEPAGDAPVWLQVYGGFGNGVKARVGVEETLWLQLGGVVATVHARGGSERGEEWHEQAQKADLALTYADVIAAGEWFVEAGWTAKGRLALSGFSNGGLTTAATVARAPHLFGAAVAGSGVHDLIRGPAMGAWWPGEYGHPVNPAQKKVLEGISPVHATPERLPPMLLTTGESDPTVTPSHSFKLAAAWASMPGGPVLLRVYPWPSHSQHLPGKKRTEALKQIGVAEVDRMSAEMVLFLARALELDLDQLWAPGEGEARD